VKGAEQVVPVHGAQRTDEDELLATLSEEGGGGLELALSSLTDEDAMLKLVMEKCTSGDELLKLAMKRPELVARLLARSIDERREIENARQEGAAARANESVAQRKQTVLVAEDDVDSNATVSWYLQQRGYEVIQAHNGLEAMQLFHKCHPDLVLCDVYMPRMNGFKILMEIKSCSPDLPVLLMTGSTSVSQVFETFHYNNVGFMTKPFRLGELGLRVQSFLGVVND
jgi:CheY-like chemotaxis protein